MIVVLTGGIASGKTVVSDEMKALGATVIDADVVAREVVAKGSPVLSQLVSEFGVEILTEAGTLDRQILKNIAFADEKKLARLNGITHPAIRKRIFDLAVAVKKGLCLVVIPLVKTLEQVQWAHRILVVDTDAEQQLKRVMRRDSVNSDLAEKIFAAQIDRETRLVMADDVINNRFDLDTLKSTAHRMYAFYCKMCSGGIKIK
ncbi:dephospho-CoA kinase [Marinicella sp. W31]|uniref:dephospho-CoA kinase n=1 Tax=Marinicella sp. W31 TaxID=3023713 RepID=UPI00375746F1